MELGVESTARRRRWRSQRRFTETTALRTSGIGRLRRFANVYGVSGSLRPNAASSVDLVPSHLGVAGVTRSAASAPPSARPLLP